MSRDLLGHVLRIAANGIGPFVQGEMQRVYGDRWHHAARASVPSSSATSSPFDLSFALATIGSNWSSVFRSRLSFADRAYVSELRDVRNRWAHQELVPDLDLDRTIDTIRRLLRAMQASEALVELDAATGVTRPGVARVPTRPPSSPPQKSARQTTGSAKRSGGMWETHVEELAAAFVAAFGPGHKRFGSKSLGVLGVCDDAAGPQWSVAMDLQSGRAWLAVNLEGMQYDGWPIARFIERELARPLLPTLAQTLDRAENVKVRMWRDAWQAAGRARILEHDISPTPLALSSVTPESWRSCLKEALGCLDPERGFRGRRRSDVTLAGSGQRIARDLSPHLNVALELVRTSATDSWPPALVDAWTRLGPVFDLVVNQARP